MKKLSEKDDVIEESIHKDNSSDVVSSLRNIIISNLNGENGKLCIYITIKLFTMIWTETDIPRLLSTDGASQIKLLVHVDINNGRIEEQMQLLFSFLFGLYHIRNFSDIVRFVYQDSKSKGTPFPYFAAGRDNVYLINSSCDKGIPLTEKSVADEYLSFFSGLSTKQYEYLEIHNSLEEFLGSLYQRFQDN